MPEKYAPTSLDFHRTGSGGLILRKRTFEEQEELSRARATHLSSLYEMSEVQNMPLNKNACFRHKATDYTATPSFGQMDPNQAAEAFRKRQAEAGERKKKDPLRTGRERKVDRFRRVQTERQPLANRQAKYVAPSVVEKLRSNDRIEVGDGIEVVAAYSLPSLC